MFDKFGEELSELNERSIKKDYFDTGEGIDLLIKATEQSAKTRSEEKRDLIARILAGATSAEADKSGYSPEEYLNIVADLTDKELTIARTIYSLQRDMPSTNGEPGNRAEPWKSCVEKIGEEHDIEDNFLPLFFSRLHFIGLLNLEYELYFDGDAVPTYWVSPAFKDLMKFLRLEN